MTCFKVYEKAYELWIIKQEFYNQNVFFELISIVVDFVL